MVGRPDNYRECADFACWDYDLAQNFHHGRLGLRWIGFFFGPTLAIGPELDVAEVVLETGSSGAASGRPRTSNPKPGGIGEFLSTFALIRG